MVAEIVGDDRGEEAERPPVVVVATEKAGSDWALDLGRAGHPVTLCASAPDAHRVRKLQGCPVLVGEGFHDDSPVRLAEQLLAADPATVVLALVDTTDPETMGAVIRAELAHVLDVGTEVERVSGRLGKLAGDEMPGQERVPVGGVELDPRSRVLRVGERSMELRPREFGVLLHLAHAAGDLVSFEELQDVQWGDPEVRNSALRSCVYRLRKALARCPSIGLEIETVRNRGYRLKVASG